VDEQDQHNDDHPAAEDGVVPAAPAAASDEVVEQLRGLVAYLAAELIDETDQVTVEAERRGPSVHLSLRVPEGELGKVIGRQGRIARAIRTSVGITAARHNLRASLDIEG